MALHGLLEGQLEVELEIVLEDATKMANFIRDQFNPECLKKPCGNLDKQHVNLLLHIGILCISRGRVLISVFELKGELQDYIQENSRPDFAQCFEDDERLEKVAHLADIFHHRKQYLQGPGENVLSSSGKILVFERKLNLWRKKNRVVRGNLEIFPCLIVKKDISKSRVLLKNTLKNCGT
jgi:hypothetical protein